MPAREAYARVEASHEDVSLTIGVELRNRDEIELLTKPTKEMAEKTVRLWGDNHARLVEDTEWFIRFMWPERAYFIETEREGMGVQVYQPFGMPKGT